MKKAWSFHLFNMKKIGKRLWLLAGIMFVCTGLSMFLQMYEFFDSNIVMIYLLGIVAFSYLAEGYLFSLMSTGIAVLLYNFFFTHPRLTFKVHDGNYIFSFVMMILFGIITSALTIRIKKEQHRVKQSEKNIRLLYEIEQNLLQVSNEIELVEIASMEIVKVIEGKVLLQLRNSEGKVIASNKDSQGYFASELGKRAREEAFSRGHICGKGDLEFEGIQEIYLPIKSVNRTLGVLGVTLNENEYLQIQEQNILEVILQQIATIYERQYLIQKQHKAEIDIHKERLRSDMLRTISHDLRTPLATIMGLSATLLENYEESNANEAKEFLSDIYEDARWLNEVVENILQATRINDGNVHLNLETEAAEEIILAAYAYVKKSIQKQTVQIILPDEILLVKVDSVLIQHVLINVIHNSLNYCQLDATIVIELREEGEFAVIEITDNGPGIDEVTTKEIFSTTNEVVRGRKRGRKGMGIGLSLCKAMVEAHGGTISVQSEKEKGTKVTIRLKKEREDNGTTHIDS